MDLLTRIKELSEAAGVSGFEDEVRQVIHRQWEPYVDELREDALGNLIGVKRGSRPAGDPRRSIMLATHCDEVGLMVSGIEEGFLRFITVGGIDHRILPGQEVMVHGRRPLAGVIGLRPPHLMGGREGAKRPIPLTELFIDVGLTAEQATQVIALGDAVSFRMPLTSLFQERVSGKAMDNRASVAALGQALELLAGAFHSWDVYAVATSQEEVGLRGAMVSAYGLMPDAAFAIDVTWGEGPSLPEETTYKMDGGPVLGVGPNVHPALLAFLRDVAKSIEMEYQIEPMPASSGTDGWAIQVCRGGIPTAVISIAAQNLHSPVEVVSLRDVSRVGRLLATSVGRLDEDLYSSLIYPLDERQPDSTATGERPAEEGERCH